MDLQDECLATVRLAVARESEASRATRLAIGQARIAGCSWDAIGRELGVTKQAARERYLVLEHLAKAWDAIALQLAQVARARQWDKSDAEAVEALIADGVLTRDDGAQIARVLAALGAALAGRRVTDGEGDRVTDGVEGITARIFVASQPPVRT
ncbi:hypothetical protein [Cellulomonas sp. Leaf395]|uniref:hypothetical protein n=1 Tax=Cellulomonas sp. Leaf395 TaxID=1736362 RepID=UPI0012FAB2E0|nr:hypothetical protein [Cellulomonas sp. Leaf395]